MKTLGLYIHIPFCRQKCGYCDFASTVAGEATMEQYITALCEEIAAQGGLFSALPEERLVDTVYLGGGTPSLLTELQVSRLFARLRTAFSFAKDAEITLEANPGTVTAGKIAAWQEAGVNRISVGVQSLQDPVLAAAGRIHNRQTALQCLHDLRQAGFTNLSADLMYGLPGQTLADVIADCRKLIELKLEHISVYGLTVEEGTAFWELQEQGKLLLPDEETEEAMYDTVVMQLTTAGYERYEISNYCLPGRQSRHNLKYWQFQDYLGLGAAAHSFMQGSRWANPAVLADYLAADWSAFRLPPPEAPELLQAEYVMLALRTAAGLDAADFQRCFGKSFAATYGAVTDNFLRQGWLQQTARGIALTQAGMKFGNCVFREYMGQ